MRLVYAKEISRDRIIFFAVHQSLANKRNEKIIQPEKIHREIDKETAGLTCAAHLLNANKKMANINKRPRVGWRGTCLSVKNVDCYGFKNVDVYP